MRLDATDRNLLRGVAEGEGRATLKELGPLTVYGLDTVRERCRKMAKGGLIKAWKERAVRQNSLGSRDYRPLFLCFAITEAGTLALEQLEADRNPSVASI